MLIAISGSREGMTRAQRVACSTILRAWGATGIVHGDCIGVDAEAHEIAMRLGMASYFYPSNLDHYRAHTERRGGIQLAAPAPPMRRNGSIVSDGEALAAFPRPSSRGTWDAVRKAGQLARPTVVLGEDGRPVLL